MESAESVLDRVEVVQKVAERGLDDGGVERGGRIGGHRSVAAIKQFSSRGQKRGSVLEPS